MVGIRAVAIPKTGMVANINYCIAVMEDMSIGISTNVFFNIVYPV